MVSSGTSALSVQTSPLGVMPSSENSLPSPTRRANENRRSNKPIMEKRRRARINNCLNELKTLILDAMKKDPARHSKLEKADILEMTVKHLQNLQGQQAAMAQVEDPSSMTKFRAGYAECASEIGRYPGLETTTKRRLLQHLANCINQTNIQPENKPKHVQVILPNPNQMEQAPVQNQNVYFGNTDIQLVPTRLVSSNGSTIALVVPSNGSQTGQNASTVPLLVPLPPRVNSASSISSSSSSSQPLSPPSSPELPPYHYEPPMQKPLSLVMKRACSPTIEKPWRPW